MSLHETVQSNNLKKEKKREFPNSKAPGAQKQNDRGFNSTDLLKN